jgi:hypothetical protein
MYKYYFSSWVAAVIAFVILCVENKLNMQKTEKLQKSEGTMFTVITYKQMC